MITGCGQIAAALSLPGSGGAAFAQAEQAGTDQDKPREEISPVEDLMREHGVLERLLLVYESQISPAGINPEFKPEPVARAAELVRRFIQDYHEKLEEQHVFPRFEKAGQMFDLVQTLRRQHDAGRRVTSQIISLATTDAAADEANLAKLAEFTAQFARMYRPHYAREDTVLFPAFRGLVPEEEYERLGEQFEEREHELFGANGFEEIVKQTAELEQQVGIYDLDQFTPRV
jgi:hemerythrin-like domain-containing protein